MLKKSQELPKQRPLLANTTGKQRSIRRELPPPEEEEEENEHSPEMKTITQVRSSLQNLLSELDQVNVLSDSDLRKKKSDLEKSYSSASELEGFMCVFSFDFL
jgi:type IV secretory pathway VirB10-like protein